MHLIPLRSHMLAPDACRVARHACCNARQTIYSRPHASVNFPASCLACVQHEAHRSSTADSPAASLSTPRSGRAPLPRPPRTTTGTSSFEDWETQLERLQLQLQELSSEKAALQSEHQAGQSKLHSLLSQRDQLQQCLQEAETGQRGVQAERDELSQRAAQLGSEGDALRQQLGQLQDQREALSRQLADAQQALSQLEDLHAGSLQVCAIMGAAQGICIDTVSHARSEQLSEPTGYTAMHACCSHHAAEVLEF